MSHRGLEGPEDALNDESRNEAPKEADESDGESKQTGWGEVVPKVPLPVSQGHSDTHSGQPLYCFQDRGSGNSGDSREVQRSPTPPPPPE